MRFAGAFLMIAFLIIPFLTASASDGTRDTTFDIGAGFNNRVWHTSIQDDGKILAGGQFTSYQGVSANRIIRLNPDGTRDTTFDMGGGFNIRIFEILIQDDGKILVGGEFTTYQGVSANGIIRLNPDGTRDTTFDMGGGFNNGIFEILIQDDGKILVGGRFTTYQGVPARRIIRLAWDIDIAIAAPTKLSSASITDTTIQVTHPTGILATDIQVHPNTTAGYSNLNCTQTTVTQVDCTISIDSSGDLAITTTTGGYGFESNYIVDTVAPPDSNRFCRCSFYRSKQPNAYIFCA